MKLLVLGGTGFLGYHFVSEALAMGHAVTTFNRDGASDFDAVEAIEGDRQGDLSALEGRRWDAVIDTFSDPEAITRTAQLLSGAVAAYGFVSGMSVYHPDGPDRVDESSRLRREGDPAGDDPLQERSLAKLACEAALEKHFDGRLLIIRPGNMVGPRDPTDRFTWWPHRFTQALTGQTPVLAPGTTTRRVQFSDTRDIAAWLVRSLDPHKQSAPPAGTYNTVGPGRDESLGEILTACFLAARDLTDENSAQDLNLTWASQDFLRDELADVEEETRPLFFPEDQIPFEHADSAKAVAAGLRFRPTYETARDTLLWRQTRNNDLQAGFSAAAEKQLLDAWAREDR